MRIWKFLGKTKMKKRKESDWYQNSGLSWPGERIWALSQAPLHLHKWGKIHSSWGLPRYHSMTSQRFPQETSLSGAKGCQSIPSQSCPGKLHSSGGGRHLRWWLGFGLGYSRISKPFQTHQGLQEGHRPLYQNSWSVTFSSLALSTSSAFPNTLKSFSAESQGQEHVSQSKVAKIKFLVDSVEGPQNQTLKSNHGTIIIFAIRQGVLKERYVLHRYEKKSSLTCPNISFQVQITQRLNLDSPFI